MKMKMKKKKKKSCQEKSPGGEKWPNAHAGKPTANTSDRRKEE